jgi:hypothetical protein
LSPPPNAEDLGWWRELLAWVGSAVVAVASGTWIVATRSKEIVATQEALAKAQLLLTERVGELESVDRDMGRFCSQQRREILDDLRREICQVIQSAMKDAKIEASADRATVATALALHTQALVGIEEDIRKIFKRLDRRHESTYVAHGRRETDHDD